MTGDTLAELRRLDGVTFHPGAGASDIETAQRLIGVTLPEDHAELLRASNGIEAYAGYVRLFGIGSGGGIDQVWWNSPSCWRFAWDERCADCWCFAETGWGDQYAYSLRSLQATGRSAIHYFDCMSFTPRLVAGSFAEFMQAEFLRCAREPYDTMTVAARRKFGSLPPDAHLVYNPSLLLGGSERIDHVQVMNARVAMICNGDIATQVDASPTGAVKGVDPYTDEHGRIRLRLVWA